MINAAVIGLGRWGKNIVESTQGKSQRIRFIRGVSKEPDQVADFARAKGFELSTDFAEAIADPRVQAVCLATPHSLHIEQIRAVAALGKPVWSEKPLALTRAEAAKAVEATKKAGVVFALGNNKRCFSSMRELKRVVADVVIGEVMHIEGNFTNEHSTRVLGGWRDDPNESPGGGMTGAGMHVIDAFVNMAGRIASVDAHNQRVQLEWWKAELGNLRLDEITPSKIAGCRDRLLGVSVRTKKPRAPATVVRYLAVLSHAFTLAMREWGWVAENPCRRRGT